MSGEEYFAVAEDAITSIDQSYKTERNSKKNKNCDGDDQNEERSPLWYRRFPSFESMVRPNLRRVRTRISRLSCLRKEEDEEIPILELQRHKSIDIGVGLARRVSLFLFTRRTVCVHPYHPYTPQQTTRKIHLGLDDKIK